MARAMSLSQIVREADQSLEEIASWPDSVPRLEAATLAVAALKEAMRGYDQVMYDALFLAVVYEMMSNTAMRKSNSIGRKKAWALLSELL